MKDGTKLSKLTKVVTASSVTEFITKQLFFLIFGFFTSRTYVLGELLPFGISVVGGGTVKYSAAAVVGALIGYLIEGTSVSTFRYIAAALGVFAIKLLLSGTKENKNPALSAAIVFAVVFSVGIVTVKKDVYDMLAAVTEALLAGAGAYFIKRATVTLGDMEKSYTAHEISSVLISTALLLSGLFGINIADISVGRVLSAALILAAARFGGSAVSVICGVTFGFMALLCGAESSVLVLYSFGGLIAGVFSALGKYAIILSFILCGFVSMGYAAQESAVIYVIEAVASGIVFLCVPKTTGIQLGKMLSVSPDTDNPVGLKKAITMRLGFAANALTDASQTVEQVAVSLAKINAPDFSSVLKGVENDACKGCTLRIHCWESRKKETTAEIIEMTKAVKCGDYEPQNMASDDFRGRCLRLGAVGNAVFKNYSDYASRIAAENRLNEVRGAVTDQFDGISEMLNDLCAEIEKGEMFDNAAAGVVSAALKNIDIRVSECCCRIDKFGRMTVEMRIKNTADTIINRIHIMRQVAIACDRDFDAPVLTNIGAETLITLNERAVLSVDIGVTQFAGGSHVMCGDAYNYFLDGRGRMIMVLSDGMGTGGRAAVDGAMASGLMGRLLKAGFGYDCSLRILNSSMLFKSTDESLATVDISVIDLFTGKTELLKAGAAPTIVRRVGRTGKAQSSSLPVGILRDVSFDKALIKLKKGDILLMMSDGVSNDGTDWICAELEGFTDGTAQELSEHIAACARRRRNDEREDDITVMAAIIGKAV